MKIKTKNLNFKSKINLKIRLSPGKRTIKVMAVSEDGRESNVVTKIFNILPCDSEESFDDSYKNADYLLQKQTQPPKRSLQSIEFSSQKWDTGLDTEIFYEEEISKPITCHYCGCEYALGQGSKF